MDFRKIFSRGSRKSWIPPLTPLIQSGRVRKFDNKNDQLTANVGWVFTANELISEWCAGVPVYLVEKKSEERIDDNEYMELLEKPNMVHTGTQFKKLHFTYLNLTGESYWLKSEEEIKGKPLALEILPSQAVSFEMGETVDKSKIRYGNKEYTAERFVRDINPDPYNPYHGRGVVEASAGSIDTELSATDFNRNVFANQARPSSVINIKNHMDDDARKRFKQELEALHTGTHNAGKPMVLEGDVQIMPYMLTHKELDYLNSRKFTKDEILAMFKVSPGMLGMTENVNRSNMEAADVLFTRSVIVPRMRQYVELLNTRLLSEADAQKYEFRFENPVPEDKEYELNMFKEGVNKWITPNEAREKMGLDPIAGGEDLEQEQVEVVDNTKDITDELVDKMEKLLKTEGSKKKLYRDDEERELIGELQHAFSAKGMQVFETDFGFAARDYFESLRDETTKKIRGVKKQFRIKELLDFLPDFKKHEKDLRISIRPVYEEAITREGVAALTIVTARTDYDIQDPDVQEFMDNRAKNIAKDVSDETEKQLRATLSQGIREKETTGELAARVEKVLGIQAQSRAQKIARTESKKASSYGQLSAWEQSGVVEKKEWYTSQDERVCPICSPLNGKTITLRSTWYKDGEEIPAGQNKNGTDRFITAYGDIDSPPVHPNCRCDMLPVLERV